MKTHCMLDLETLGTGPDAMILSIGATKFDPSKEGVIDSFHVGVDLSQVAHSIHGLYGQIDPATVGFWLAKEREAGRAALDEVSKTDMASALDGFAMWLGDQNALVWGNGAAFDNVILRRAFERLGLDTPWSHWNDRCYRTIKNLAPAIVLERFGAHHSALDDAVSQTLHLQRIFSALELVA